jgi:hypothetical protein
MSLYTDLIDAAIPVSHWQSDLYCKATEQSKALILKHNCKFTTFFNQNGGGYWYEIPFQYDPFWSNTK